MRLEVEPRAIEFIIKKRKEKTKKLNLMNTKRI